MGGERSTWNEDTHLGTPSERVFALDWPGTVGREILTGHMFGPGEIIGDRYRIVDLIGSGGMGSVWRAEHISLKSPVAIKLIEASAGISDEIAARFMREAQSAAALRSTHVVQIFDYGLEQGIPYIAMELLEGESLRARLDRDGRLEPRYTARIMMQVARAVGKAHDAGIVHRDLKPDNIFLVREEDQEITKVLDFGIAKINEGVDKQNLASHTRTGAVLGTPYYMSPEQAQGNKTVDTRSDIWAMGVIAFECVVGQLPFQSEALGDLILKICMLPLPIPSALGPVPVGFDEWFAKTANRDPEQRFQTAREAAETLRLVLGAGRSLSERPAATVAMTLTGNVRMSHPDFSSDIRYSTPGPMPDGRFGAPAFGMTPPPPNLGATPPPNLGATPAPTLGMSTSGSASLGRTVTASNGSQKMLIFGGAGLAGLAMLGLGAFLVIRHARADAPVSDPPALATPIDENAAPTETKTPAEPPKPDEPAQPTAAEKPEPKAEEPADPKSKTAPKPIAAKATTPTAKPAEPKSTAKPVTAKPVETKKPPDKPADPGAFSDRKW